MTAPHPLKDSDDFCLNILQSLLGIQEDDQILHDYLESLRPYLSELRTSFRNPNVSVEYRTQLCHAYLLAYVPPYLHQAKKLFERFFQERELPDSISVVFLATGPGTEPVAFTDYLLDNYPDIKAEFNFFDLREEHWSQVRDSMVKFGISNRTDNISCTSHYLNLLEVETFEGHNELLRNADVVIVQNCINELLHEAETAKRNLLKVVSLLSAGTVFLSSDLSQSPGVKRFVSELRNDLRDFGELEPVVELTHRRPLPESGHTLLEHFYDRSQRLRPRFQRIRNPRKNVNAIESAFIRGSTYVTSELMTHIVDQASDEIAESNNFLFNFRIARYEVLNGNEEYEKKLELDGYLKLENKSDLLTHMKENRSICIALAIARRGAAELEETESNSVLLEIRRSLVAVFKDDAMNANFQTNSDSMSVHLKWPHASFVNVAHVEVKPLSNPDGSLMSIHTDIRRGGSDLLEFPRGEEDLVIFTHDLLVNVYFGVRSPATGRCYWDTRAHSCNIPQLFVVPRVEVEPEFDPEVISEVEPPSEEGVQKVRNFTEKKKEIHFKKKLLQGLFDILYLGTVFTIGYFLGKYIWGLI